MNRLQHDAAWDAATRLLDVVSMAISEENRPKVLGEFYLIIREAIASCGEKMARQERRLNPEGNWNGT